MSIHLFSYRVDGCVGVCMRAPDCGPFCRAARCVRSWWQMVIITVSDISVSVSSSPPLPSCAGGLFFSLWSFLFLWCMGLGWRPQTIRDDKGDLSFVSALRQSIIFSFYGPLCLTFSPSLSITLSSTVSIFSRSIAGPYQSCPLLCLSVWSVVSVCTSRSNI